MQHVTVEVHDGIALVRMERPPANALDPVLGQELIDVGSELCSSPPRAVVLTGHERAFSAGLDLKIVPTLEPELQREMVMGVNRMVAAWYPIEAPVVAAVNGHAIAGGLVLALCADYRVGSTTGKLGLTEVRAGIPFPAAAIALVLAELAPPVARVLCLRGELLDPPAALEARLVDELAHPEGVVTRALDVAGELAALPAPAYAKIKRQLRERTIAEVERIVREDDDPLADTWLSGETAAAAAALLRPTGSGSPN